MIKIEFDPADLKRVKNALKTLRSEIRSEVEECPRRMAEGYKREIIRNILTQRYKWNYAPYDERYKKWKEKVGMANRGFWILTGDLMLALSVNRFTEGYFSGILSNVTDMGGKSWFGNMDKGPSKNIAAYGWIMERGGNFGKGGDHPKRALFEPTFNDFKAKQALTILKVSANKIAGAWR